ncbi:hypothetical protein HDU98_007250 [Podochytrium sp. JEL0797]|nr:hypothetical protein HDU98_007250 [Podochytrium sp. JEL0797]
MQPVRRFASQATASSSSRSPAAKLLQKARQQNPQPLTSSDLPPAKDLLSKAESSSPTFASTASAFNPLKQFDGLRQLHANASTYINLGVNYFVRSERVERRDAIRLLLRTGSDLKVITPSALYLAFPFKSYTLPFVFHVLPGLVPSSYYTEEVMGIKARTVQSKREKSAVAVVESMSKQVGKLGEEFVFDKGTVAAVSMFKKLMLNTSAITFSDLTPLLYPLFVSRLPAATGLSNPSQLTSFLNLNFPFLTPRTRLIQWADWILKDDAMIRREGVHSMTRFELLEALEERGFINLADASLDDMRSTLKYHTKCTKWIMDAIVGKRSMDSKPVYKDDYAKVELVAKDLGLTSDELGGVATLMVFARALDVKS